MKKTIVRHKISMLILVLMISAGSFYACNQSSVTAPTQADNLSFNVLGSMDSVGDSQSVLILDTVKILIKDIKLEYDKSSEDSCDFKVGPFVLFLNLQSSVNPISTAIIPAGNYKKIKFEIHKLNDNEAVPDPDFADINGRYSVVVKGRYEGNSFVYKSTKSAHQKLQFQNMIPLTLASASYITLVIRPYIWFIKSGAYLDPRIPANSNDIDNNIKNNINNHFKAFRDNNRDGVPD